jgi:hypothetical protein
MTEELGDVSENSNVDADANEDINESNETTDEKVSPDWPDDWRNKMAGEDEKTLKRLGRFNSPNDMFKSYRAMEQKVSSGELKTPLADNATEEQVKAYRADNGIPEEAKGYFEDMPDGLVIGEDDKEIFESVAEKFHGLNAKPEVMHALVGWYEKFQEDAAATQHESDQDYQKNSEDELRTEWGAEYRSNINTLNAFMNSSFPEGMGDTLLQARLEDGSIVGNNPELLRAFASMARVVNPAATVVPNAGADAGASIQDEIDGIKKEMGNKGGDYWKGPKTNGQTKMQRRYSELLDAQTRMKRTG